MSKLIEFFKNLFSGLFGSSKKQPPSPPVTKTDDPAPEIKDPKVEEPKIEPPVETSNPPVEDTSSEVVVDEPITEPAVEPEIITPIEDPVIDDDDDEEPEPPTEIPTDVSDVGDFRDDPIINDTVVETPVTEEPETIPIIEEPTENKPAHKARYLWCLDNGHGKKTAGKRSPKLNGERLYEYEFNRDIVKRIIQTLDVIGVETFNVVPEVDVDNFLEGRVARANRKKSDLPKLFVSIHSNAAPAPPGKWSNPSISGVETWFFHNSNRGKKMASVFQKHIVKATGWKDRFIKSQPGRQFYVLKNTSMTAVLTENGFYNNLEQCKLLKTDEVRQKIADAHVQAILEIEKNGI